MAVIRNTKSYSNKERTVTLNIQEICQYEFLLRQAHICRDIIVVGKVEIDTSWNKCI